MRDAPHTSTDPAPASAPAVGAHPWVLAVSVLLVAWSAARMQVQPSSLPPALLAALTWPTLAYGAARLLRFPHHRAAILATLATGWLVAPTFVGHGGGLLAATLALAGGALLVGRARRPLRNLSGILDVSAAAMLVVPALELAQDLTAERAPRVAEVPPLSRVPTDPPLPDIYVVVLDAYGRADVLEELYGFDNQPFLDGLGDMGFSIADQARSNYGQTGLSIASLFQARYLHEVLDGLGPEHHDRRVLHHLVRHAPTLQLLRESGYELVNLRGPFSMVDLPQVDRKVQPFPRLDDFHLNLIGLTPLPDLSRLVGLGAGRLQHAQWARQIRWSLDTLPRVVPADAPPSFVFVHIVSPHPPFVLDDQGDTRTVPHAFHLQDGAAWRALAGVDEATYRAHYAAQLEYTNRRVLQALQALLSRDRPAMVLLMGDHGPGLLLEPGDPSPSPEALGERFGILLAWRGGQLPHGATPINAFRALLRSAVGAELPPVDDISWYAPYDTPYAFSIVEPQPRPLPEEAEAEAHAHEAAPR